MGEKFVKEHRVFCGIPMLFIFERNNMKNKIIKLISLLLAMITLILTLSSCSKGVEIGFDSGNGGDPSPPYPHFHASIKSDKDKFDIDDVTLEFGYGIEDDRDIQEVLEVSSDIPSFDLYFRDEEDNKYFIRHSEDNLVSEKYRITFDKEEQKYVYNYSETITVPKELFDKERGYLLFSIYGINIKQEQPKYRHLAGGRLYYRVYGDKVRILENEKTPFESIIEKIIFVVVDIFRRTFEFS